MNESNNLLLDINNWTVSLLILSIIYMSLWLWVAEKLDQRLNQCKKVSSRTYEMIHGTYQGMIHILLWCYMLWFAISLIHNILSQDVFI